MQSREDFTDQVAIVTGGAMGIGKQIVKELSEKGAAIVVCDTEKELGDQVVNTLTQKGAKSLFLAADVTDEMAVHQVIEKTQTTFGRIDILVNNAGISLGTPLEEISAEEWDLILAINLKGPFLFIKHVAQP